MPRPAVQHEDRMTDEEAEGWESVSESLGTKIEWAVGTRFIGEYTGTTTVTVDDEDIEAAQFTNAEGKHFCWIPYALQQVLSSGKLTPGQQCYIKCTGEESTKRGLNKVKVFDIKVKP